tara:strand:- start:129 stop:848 length:720 start_codon:yes stop_codon:yes gene_type:complete
LVADLNRLFVGISLLLVVCFSYFLNLDLILLFIIVLFVLYDLYALKLINSITQILIISFILILYYLINNFDILWTYLCLIQLSLILLTLLISRYKFILFNISVCIFCLILFLINNADRNIFYLIIGISFFNDTIAYIFGSKIKGPLILPNISPKKTWSGTLISFFLSTIILIILNFDIFFSVLISIFLFLGDIFFSFIKRSLNIKDFSSALGNHGGILDRLDSMFLISIFFQLYLIINL